MDCDIVTVLIYYVLGGLKTQKDFNTKKDLNM